MRSTTDSQPGVNIEDPGAGVRNLLTIFQAFMDWPDDQVRQHFAGMRYGDLKKQVAEAVLAKVEPIQARYREITADPGHVAKVLEEGAARVTPLARETVQKAKRAMGLFTPD